MKKTTIDSLIQLIPVYGLTTLLYPNTIGYENPFAYAFYQFACILWLGISLTSLLLS